MSVSADARSKIPPEYDGWKNIVARYTKADPRKATWQLITSFGGLFVFWILMYLSLSVGYWLTLLLAVPTAGFVVRIFIIQHDCGHGSFFGSKKANDWTGTVCSLFTFVAYKYWRKSHAIHHATHAELEERGTGDVWTLTVDEYLTAPWWKKAAYRVFRNPFFLFGIAPSINFLIMERFPLSADEDWHNGEKASVWWTDLALLVLYGGIILAIGFWNALAILIPMMIISSSAGVWLFYVQHQYERTYWEHTPQWSYTLAAMHGSSYYRLPRVLQWFTGNIGFHHIHHLSPRIPNYNLERCHKENEMMQRVVILDIRSSLRTARYALWDEDKRQLITFREAIEKQRAAVPASAA